MAAHWLAQAVLPTGVVKLELPSRSEVFVSRITRKELKSDQFALEVEHTFSFFEEHRAEVIRYGAIAAGVIVLIVAFLLYSRHAATVRQDALAEALQAQDAPVNNPNAPLSFPSEDARRAEALKRLSSVASKYSGSDEGTVATYYIAANYADEGKIADAEKNFKTVADSGNAAYASLAKMALAQIYFGDGRTAEGEKLLRGLIDSPTVFVSKEQATVSLARGLMNSKPAEARKLVEPLRTIPGQIGQVAISLYGEIPAQ